MSLNIEAIDKTIVRIRDNVDEIFNMQNPSQCIIGFAKRANNLSTDSDSSKVGKLFGFTESDTVNEETYEISESTKLFFFTPYRYDDIKREHAVKVLEHLRDTGKVDWTVAGVVPTTK